MTARHFRVTGRVQGVGFRQFVLSTADSLDLTGEVWNTRDDAVEGIVQGERIDHFVSMLHKGPGFVESVVTSETGLREFAGFIIGPTR
jgi:acylphosphatase